jgi:hypothetical protein
VTSNLENEEAKALYRAVENTTTIGCNARKTNKNTCFVKYLYLSVNEYIYTITVWKHVNIYFLVHDLDIVQFEV